MLINLLFKSRVLEEVAKLNPSRLTVLNYHRIEEPDSKRSFFKPNISASPKMFGNQLDFLAQKFNLISLSDLVLWLSGGEKLPSNSALITFDDGYLDNYTNAFPQLKKRNIPAVIFLATDYIGRSRPFYWDLIAWSFHQTKQDHLSVPKFGDWSWADDPEKDDCAHLVIELLKKQSEQDKEKIIEKILQYLRITIADDAFSNLFLNWDQVRMLQAAGIEMGAHTKSHPILTRVPIEVAIEEMRQSKLRIEQEIKKDVISFAYPNGQLDDFSPEIVKGVESIGYLAAFTLLAGPQAYRSVKKNQFTIRRIFLSHRDTLPKFAAKLYGLPRLMERFGKDMG